MAAPVLALRSLGEEAVLGQRRGQGGEPVGALERPETLHEALALGAVARREEALEDLAPAVGVEELGQLAQELAFALGEELLAPRAQAVDDPGPTASLAPQAGALHQSRRLERAQVIPDRFARQPFAELAQGSSAETLELREQDALTLAQSHAAVGFDPVHGRILARSIRNVKFLAQSNA